MAFVVDMSDAQRDFPEYTFHKTLTPSVQKAAFHVSDGEGNDLCLKIIAPAYSLDRLDREIQALQKINHKNVVRLIEYTFSSTAEKQRHYLVEEFIDGNDLTVSLESGQQWPWENAAQFFAQLCEGLSALHAERIVHRDLKPSNIRVRSDGSPVIIDFGLARHLQLPDLTSTGQGAAIGTPLYFAPEQFVGNKYDIDCRTDLFAVGVMLYQALVGQHPFAKPNMSLSDAVLKSSEHLQAEEFASLPADWKTLIKRLLAKERALRPHSPDMVVQILRKMGGEQ